MASVRRNGLQEAGLRKQIYDQEFRLLRAKNNNLTTTDIKRSLQAAFGRTRE
jgi:hypothetical protein